MTAGKMSLIFKCLVFATIYIGHVITSLDAKTREIPQMTVVSKYCVKGFSAGLRTKQGLF